MLQVKENQRVMVWDVKVSNRVKNTVEAILSSSKKEEHEDYIYFNWSAKFVGQAFEKAKSLQEKDVIILKSAAVENHFDKEKEKLYVTVVVFDFDIK